MHDGWLGWCAAGAHDDLERALLAYETNAALAVVDSPQELRKRVRNGEGRVGAAVGPSGDVQSGINVAAAIVSDGFADEVLLVVDGLTSEVRTKAAHAGITVVMDLSQIVSVVPDDLDEPSLVEDELPTMVAGAGRERAALLERVPAVVPGAKGTKPCVALERDTPAEAGLSCERAADRFSDNGAQPLVLTPDMMRRPRAVEPDRGYVPALQQATGLLPSRTEEISHVAEAPKAPIVTFVSGRGGVGKTSVVAVMAVIASSWGMRVALCDLDLSCGNLYSCFGLRGPADLGRICSSESPSEREILEAGEGAFEGVTLWGGCELPEMAEAVMPNVGMLVRTVAASHDLVLVDTSSTFTDAVAQAAQLCSRLVLVVDGKAGSAVAQRRLGSLAVRLGVARTRMMRLANHCGPRGRGEPDINRADLGLETARPLRVMEGGAEVAECLAAGNPQDLIDLGSRFTESCATSLAATLAELGSLPDVAAAQRALQAPAERLRWGFGKRREAM